MKYLISLTILLFANVGFCSGEDVLSLASKSWKETREVYLQTEMEIVTTRNDKKHDPTARSYNRGRTELFRSGINQSLIFTHLDNEDGSEMQNVYAENLEYGFELARRKDTNPWKVMAIAPRGSGDIDCHDDTGVAPWSILDLSLANIIEDPSFKLISIADEVASDGGCKVVSFELNSTGKGLIGELRSCKLRLCPAHNYLVHEFDATFEREGGGFRGVGRCTYDGTISNVPRLQTYIYELTTANKKNILWTAEITRLEMCTKSKSDYTLTAFGLSEPKQANSTYSSVWIAVAAAALIGVAMLFRRYSEQ